MEIRIENLTKAYGNFKAVDNLTLSIKDGDLVGLLGPSGCGKSTTLFMIAGLTDPTAGSVWFGDKNVTKVAPEDREVGLVFQNYALYPHMTVEDNIMFPLINRKVPKEEARKRAREMAEMVHLENLLDRKPKALSGGQQQRVAIARALVKKPEVLLLDEPLSNLDAKLRVETREEIRRIQQEVHITTIFVTHDQEEAMSISDKIAVIDRGVLQQYEIPQKMYLNPCNLFVASFLGTPEINIFDAEVKNGTIIAAGNVLRENCNVPDGSYKAGVRPESFNVSLQPDVLPGAFRTEASRVRMTGRELQIRFPMGSNECRLLVHSDMQIRKGTPLYLTARDNSILLFDGQGAAIGKF
ncbi:MAG: ABC transporter ATP-binding protein [Lachnospiraceae bacterium]|jgi:multiple sugar transport system ATP-binding protein